MAQLFGVEFDPTPGFNLGFSDKANQSSRALNSFKGSGGGGPQFSNPTGQSKAKASQGTQQQPTGGKGQVQGTTYSAPVDPYAQWGGRASYDRMMSGFDTQKQNIFGTAREAAQNSAIGYQGGILDFIESLRSGQQGIDERGVQNELSKRQGTSSITDMVGRGIRSGGTMLAGRNALDSSAAEQLGRAYGDIGQRELSKVGNQYELENRNIGLAQTDFDQQMQSGARQLEENKTQVVNNIVAEARNGLAALDAAMIEADAPTRVQLEQEKNRIKQDALTILGQYDQTLTQGMQGIDPTSTDDRRRTAADLANRGVAAANPFSFSAQAPAQFAGTGPFASELPLFTYRGNRQQEE
jgi:hypothetical protein